MGRQPSPEVARPGDVGGVLLGTLQIESIENMYGMDRSPKAVSAAPTRAVAPPKFQIEESVLGDGGARVALDDPVDHRIVQPAQVVALPVAAVLAERDERVEQALDVAVAHLAGEVGHRLAELAQGLQQPFALAGVAVQTAAIV